MSKHRIESELWWRLHEMTDAEFAAVVQDFIYLLNEAAGAIAWEAGKPFVEVMAAGVADEVRKNPSKMERLKELAPSMPGLAFHLIPYFPGLPWPKDTAERRSKPQRKPTRNEYVEAEMRNRDALEDQWRAITAKIRETEFPRAPRWKWPKLERRVARAPLRRCPPGTRTEELIACAKFKASAHTLGASNPLKAHAREQQIDALARFLARLAVRTDSAAARGVR